MITVCCFFWKDPHSRWHATYRYTPEHVNRLRNMVKRHLSLPHEFVCITDQPQGLDGGMRIVRFDALSGSQLFTHGRHWPKLSIFRPDAAEWLGRRIFCMDLDTVILGNIDRIVDRPEDAVFLYSPESETRRKFSRWNSSFVLLTAGARPQVWTTDLDAAKQAVRESGHGGSDQAWISICLPDEACWTHEGAGIYPIRMCQPRPPEGARMVYFAGRRDPSVRAWQQQCPWIGVHWR